MLTDLYECMLAPQGPSQHNLNRKTTFIPHFYEKKIVLKFSDHPSCELIRHVIES